MTSWTTGSQGHGHPGPPRSFLLAVPPGAAAHNTGCVSITEGDQQGPGTLGVPAPGAGSLHCLPPLPQECRREHWAWGPTPWVPGGLALHMSLGTCRPGSLCPTSPRAQQQGPAAAAEEGHPGHPQGPHSGHTGLPAAPGRQTPALSRPPNTTSASPQVRRGLLQWCKRDGPESTPGGLTSPRPAGSHCRIGCGWSVRRAAWRRGSRRPCRSPW